MRNDTIHNIFSFDEIEQLVNDSVVQINKDKLSDEQPVVKFSIPLSDSMKSTLENWLLIDLSHVTTIPIRWIRGDTPPHVDKGETEFNDTYLIYLTDSIGKLTVDGKKYSIVAGDAHIFSEGLEHSTENTENNDRLMIGPMSETGLPVGAVELSISFSTNTFVDSMFGEGFTYITWPGSAIYHTITIFNIPPPSPVTTDDYNIYDYVNSVDWTPPSGKIFGGWQLMDRLDNSPIGDTPPSNGIYMPGETYTFTTNSWLVPNWIDGPIATLRNFSMRSLFTDNSLVYYKPGSLSTGGGGSGVKNSRHKQRKT
jgi:hypothetical protein